ncbi:hypothetical protein LBJG_01373 [Lactobacillus jensenii 1153]|nr:hypothetical protein LBJG_01373 [Lactobacillus jensenii 1153]ERJ43337.1 hypothetical protein N581_09490 [Lactobacillus jensenii MD IIE-70(2)]
MINLFFDLAVAITLVFAIAILLLTVCYWLIYFRIEQSFLYRTKNTKESNYDK